MENQILDYQSEETMVPQQADRLRRTGHYLELVPILVLCGGMFMYQQGMDHWKTVILFGGGLSVFIYTMFSAFMYHIGRYRSTEFGLSAFSGVLFATGISNFIFPAYNFMAYCLWGCVALFVISLGLFIYHIADDRASLFYRSLIARVMIFGAILFRLWY